MMNFLPFFSKPRKFTAKPGIPLKLHFLSPEEIGKKEKERETKIDLGEATTGHLTIEIFPYNPDDLVQSKTLEIFDEMKKDDQIKAALNIKKLARLSTPWFIKPASRAREDLEIADFIRECFLSIPGSFSRCLWGILSALDYGFSVSEKIYSYIEEGPFRGKIALKDIKTRKPHDFEFKLDKFSNIKAVLQNQGGGWKEIDPKKIIIFTWNEEFKNPYGISDLKAAYRPWWTKDVLMKFWNLFLERYPSPILIGFYPPGTPKEEREQLLSVLEEIQVNTVAIAQEGMRIESIETGRIGSEIYSRAIEKMDRMICRSLLVPDLLGMTESQSRGSYALGKKHFDVFLWVLYYLGEALQEVINEQVIRDLVDINFEKGRKYPEFVFESVAEETAESKARIISLLVNAKILDPEDPFVRDWITEYLALLPQSREIITSPSKFLENL